MKIIFWNCGGTGNFGDDLCHLGAIEWCRQTYGEFHHERIFKLNQHTVEKVNQADLLVIGGGQLLDGTDFLAQLVSQSPKCPYIFLGVGIGSESDITPYKESIKPEKWIVRDSHSVGVLQNCGIIDNVFLIRDLSFLMPIEFKGRDGKSIGLNLKNCGKTESFVTRVAACIDLVELPVILFALNSTDPQVIEIDGEMAEISDGNGLFMAQSIQDRVQNKALVKIVSYEIGKDDPLVFAQNFGLVSLFIGERLHSVITAFRAGVPFKAIPYHQKVTNFLSDENLSDSVIGSEVNDICTAMESLKC